MHATEVAKLYHNSVDRIINLEAVEYSLDSGAEAFITLVRIPLRQPEMED